MSFNFWLYRAIPNLGPLTQWPESYAQALGSSQEIREALSAILRQVKWSPIENQMMRADAFDENYSTHYRLCLHEDEAGNVALISTSNHASPKTLARIMDHLSLNYCCTDFGDCRHPHLCDDNWIEQKT